MSIHEINDHSSAVTLLDVRSPGEWQAGHMPGARHLPLPRLAESLGQLEKDKPVAVYCGSGYRASIGASILQAHGFRDVRNVPGSWSALERRRLPSGKRKPGRFQSSVVLA